MPLTVASISRRSAAEVRIAEADVAADDVGSPPRMWALLAQSVKLCGERRRTLETIMCEDVEVEISPPPSSKM
jgi:hypothetical protein